MKDLTILSNTQRQIYDLLAAGKTAVQIAKALDTSEVLVRANMTRIKNKGIDLPDKNTPVEAPPANTIKTTQVLGGEPSSKSRPAPTGRSSNEQIINSLTGTAIDAKQLQELADKVAGKNVVDIHPLALLGVTIQYVKLCGGRMTAHQVIEDVYSALRGFVQGGKPIPGDDGEASPLPQSERERLSFLEEQNKKHVEKIAELERKTAQPSGYSTYR